MGKINLSFFKNKKVFITGHTGFKGTWLTKILILAGAKVYGYSLDPDTTPNLFEISKIEKDIVSIIGDIRNYKKLFYILKKIKPEIVFHLAAQPIVRESYINPYYTYQVNVMGTVNLLEAIRNITSVKSFLNITTDKVYENSGKNYFYKENDKLCGLDPYSNSKSCSDIITFSYSKSFLKNIAVSTVRSGNVIGGGDFAKDRIIPDCYRAIENNKPVFIRNPESIRPYQFILDCLSGYLILAEKQYKNKNLAGSYNFGPEKGDIIKNIELVNLFNENLKNKFKIAIKKDNRYYEADILKLNTEKAKKVLKWKPYFDVEKAIELTAKWYDTFIDGGDANEVMEKQILNYFKV